MDPGSPRPSLASLATTRCPPCPGPQPPPDAQRRNRARPQDRTNPQHLQCRQSAVLVPRPQAVVVRPQRKAPPPPLLLLLLRMNAVARRRRPPEQQLPSHDLNEPLEGWFRGPLAAPVGGLFAPSPLPLPLPRPLPPDPSPGAGWALARFGVPPASSPPSRSSNCQEASSATRMEGGRVLLSPPCTRLTRRLPRPRRRPGPAAPAALAPVRRFRPFGLSGVPPCLTTSSSSLDWSSAQRPS